MTTTDRCTTCGCELDYPTAMHLVDCQPPATTDRELKPGDRDEAPSRDGSKPSLAQLLGTFRQGVLAWHHDDRAELAAEVERLRAEQSDVPDESPSTKPDTDGIMRLLLAENRLLRRQRDEARAQVAAMRDVLEAAEAFVVHRLRGQRWTLEDAVDAYRADQT